MDALRPALVHSDEEAARALGPPPETPGAWERALRAAAGGAPYLARLIGQRPEAVGCIRRDGPPALRDSALARAREAASLTDFDAMMDALREAKADLHLACAIGDLSGAWSLSEVTGALSDLADAALQSALAGAARLRIAQGDLLAADIESFADPKSPIVPGLIILAMGKHGARELNYSSDIDVTLFFDPDALPLAPGKDARTVAVRIGQSLVKALEELTPKGYVFRTDLRLRPDPGSTAIAVSVAAAEIYYQSVGQNWERAAFIKARPAAGDIAAGRDFLDGMRSFVWRRHLDYAAIADIHSIKRQMLARGGADLNERSFDVKLGRGGIRDIELFVQTQQLILGGRREELRASDTVGALEALADGGVVTPAVKAILIEAYAFFRAIEHRIQMLEDAQTHRMPASAEKRARLAALAGFEEAAALDAALAERRGAVARIDAELFAGAESLADPAGSLSFTGVEDDPETLRTLRRMGFSQPEAVSATVRGWHHGRIRATRSERARELLTALMPTLLRAIADSGEPDAAFVQFNDFLKGLPAGVQVFSLFQAQPALLKTVAAALGLAPRLARTLAQRPALLDSMIEPRFARPLKRDPAGERMELLIHATAGVNFETAINAARRVQREEAFRIDLQVLLGEAGPHSAGEAHADLAEACVRVLAASAEQEVSRRMGPPPGAFTVLALGKFGGRELAENSDLDIMLVYDAPAEHGEFYTRLSQRLISAISAQTEEGMLYAVDMQLRPSGSHGPVAVRLPAFERYYREDAWTWEFQALTRLRPVAGDEALGARALSAARDALCAPRDAQTILADVAAMRGRMERDKPSSGKWDLKLAPGGLIDIEFIAQALELVTAPRHPEVIAPNTGTAIANLMQAGAMDTKDAALLSEAWRLYSHLQQCLRIVVEGAFEPKDAPATLRALLAGIAGVADFATMELRLEHMQTGVRAIFERCIGAVAPPA